MKFLVYSKDNCPKCVTAKEMLKTKGKEFKVLMLDADYTRGEFVNLFPGISSLPMITADGVRVGGLDQLRRFLNVGS